MQYGYGARVRRLLRYSGCLLALAPLLGCSGNNGGPGGGGVIPLVTTGTLAGRVTVFGTQQAIANALVTVGGRTTTTSAAGTYSVASLAVGDVPVGVTAAGFSDNSGTVTIAAGTTTVHDVVLFARPPGFPNLN
ncbi:MAG: carboxypeptidase regulatory-like domain-containing protein [Armatimonadetes bacterium]|nr:carboxypeptidase regulatory-like domain-containing protein [Armatimonadota bacterium]